MEFDNNVYTFFSYIITLLDKPENLISNFTNIFTILSIFIPFSLYLINKALYLFRLKNFSKTKRPYWLSEEEFYFHTHNYVKTRLITSQTEKLTFNKFITKIIVKSQKQFHLILGESGTGKSTFLINLYYRYNCRIFRHGYTLEYFPLKSPDTLQQIKQLKKPQQTILLLDAFDEANKANINADNFLKEIEKITCHFAKVIISSRNNFFDNESSVPSKIQLTRILSLNEEKYNKYYIQPFTNKDIIIYIAKRYKLLLHKYIKSFMVLRRCGDIVCRPLVLSYIDLLIQNNTYYKNLSDVYNEIIANWINRESHYIISQTAGNKIEEIEKIMFAVVSDIAIFMYKNFPEQKDYYIRISDLNKIKNANFLEHTNGKRNRSLFDRMDDKLIFAHKSILEYLLAINFNKLDFRFEAHLNTLYNFLHEMGGENWSSKFSALFHINYADSSPQITKNEQNPHYLYARSINIPVNRKFISTMIVWYQNALLFPVFVDGKLYKRESIEIKLQDKYLINITSQQNQLILIENIMHIIKVSVANRNIVKIIITTFLIEHNI